MSYINGNIKFISNYHLFLNFNPSIIDKTMISLCIIETLDIVVYSNFCFEMQ